MYWIAGIGSVLVPAVIVAAVARRWLARAIVLWLIVPWLIYFGIIGLEMATRPLEPKWFENMIFGFMLVTTIGIIPWLAACLLGFGAGALLRRRRPAQVLPDRPAS